MKSTQTEAQIKAQREAREEARLQHEAKQETLWEKKRSGMISREEFKAAEIELEKIDPQNAHLYTKNEPTWLKNIGLNHREYLYRKLCTPMEMDDYFSKAFPLPPHSLERGVIKAIGLILFDLCVFLFRRRIPQPLLCISILAVPIINIPILLGFYNCHVDNCQVFNARDRERARFSAMAIDELVYTAYKENLCEARERYTLEDSSPQV